MFNDHTTPSATPAGPGYATPTDARSAVADALADLRAGRMVIVTDDDERPSDLVAAAGFATAEVVNFMATHGRGLVRVALTAERCDALRLRAMRRGHDPTADVAFTLSVEARTGVTTGISAADRARTIAVAADPAAGPEDLVVPGHVFPLRAHAGGVLEQRGRPEAAVDLARLAGLAPAGVLCEILDDDGEVARGRTLRAFAARHGLRTVTVAELATHRRTQERRLDRIAEAMLPTAHGTFRIVGYRSRQRGHEHVALVHGTVLDGQDVPVYLHRSDLARDVFAGGPHPLRAALEWVQSHPCGVVVHLVGDDALAGLRHRAADPNAPRPAADVPDPTLAAQILTDLGVRSARLLQGDRLAVEELAEHGILARPVSPAAPAPVDALSATA